MDKQDKETKQDFAANPDIAANPSNANKPDVRKLALKALNRVIDGGAYTDVVCDKIQRDSGLSDKDNRLFTELVTGIVKSRLTIDHILNKFVPKGFSKLPPVLRNILRLGAYQLLYLDRVPAFAAVNSATELTKTGFGQSMAGLVNGVLRNLQNKVEKTGRSGILEANDMPLAVRFSIPEELSAFLEEELIFRPDGYLEELLHFFHQPSATYLRVNRINTSAVQLFERLSKEGVEAEYSATLPEDVLILKSGKDPRKLKSWKEGHFQLQSFGSTLSPILLDPAPCQTVLDMCSAPGGKTSHLSALIGEKGLVIAVEINKKRLEDLQINCSRLGAHNIAAVNGDATTISAIVAEKIDKVLLDAPCSGLGTIGRKADLRYHFDPTKLMDLVKLQRKLIHEALKVLKPGGELLYSVCTFTQEETIRLINEVLADDFRVKLSNGRPRLKPEDCWITTEELQEFRGINDVTNVEVSNAENDSNIVGIDNDGTALKTILEKKGAIYLDPVSFNTDGFFYAKLIKVGN